MSELPALFQASLNPHTRKPAEASLLNYANQPEFGPILLAFSLEARHDRAVRLAAAVYLKNMARKRWQPDPEEELSQIVEADKVKLRANLIPAMIALASANERALRAQIAETVSLIAAVDFPEQWPTLFDDLVGSLSPTQLHQTLAVLETAHSICGPWRSAIRSDELYSMINIVISRFSEPYIQCFRAFSATLLGGTDTTELELKGQISLNLLQLYYDLTAQDLPPIFEDSIAEFFGPKDGWFPRYLIWASPELSGEPEDTTPSLLSRIKTTVLEITELFILRYSDLFTDLSVIVSLIQTVWTIASGGAHTSVGDDALIAQCMRLLSTTVKTGQYKSIYEGRAALEELVRGIIVPNVQFREHDEEQFEDDPLEFIRLDLSLPSGTTGSASFSSTGGGDGTTRRHAAADVLRALIGSGYEAETTDIVSNWVHLGLQEYSSSGKSNWKSKSSAIYLISAVTARGYTTQHGVTSANPLVDIVKFFSDYVAEDLQASTASIHPILEVDAIRFLYTFRNQLNKDQLLAVLPLLVQHLNSPTYVGYTYASIAIERILFMKQNNQPLFTPKDVSSFAQSAIEILLSRMEAGKSAEKIAENDYLMKCVMRLVITARSELVPGHAIINTRLVAILGSVSRNPSNPHFNQFTFESVSALVRFTVPASPDSLSGFEQSLVPALSYILEQDIDQFVPYSFQVLCQLLELNTGEIPGFYLQLLALVLQPPPWQQKGSIPGLVRYIRAYLDKDAATIIQTEQLLVVLGIIQQRLIPSKLHDSWAFELLEGVVSNVPAHILQPYLRDLIMTLLNRLQTSRTDKYTIGLVHWICYVASLESGGYDPNIIPTVIDAIQPNSNLWSSILKNVLLPALPKVPPKDKRVVVVGLTRILLRSQVTVSADGTWPFALTSLLQLFASSDHAGLVADEDPDSGITAIDYEEQNVGYQVAYSKLAASEIPRPDPVAYAGDPKDYLFKELAQAIGKTGAQFWIERIRRANSPLTDRFIEEYSAAGYKF